MVAGSLYFADILSKEIVYLTVKWFRKGDTLVLSRKVGIERRFFSSILAISL